ncbi:MAG: hypothetical protein ACRCY4_06645 [Brevinema sp.]
MDEIFKRLKTSPKVEIAIATVLFAISIFVNYAVTAGGTAVRDVSDRFPTPITPPGFTFAIWGVIYLFALASLGIWASYAWKKSPMFEEQRYAIRYFMLISVLNALWIVSWTSLLIPIAWLFIVGIWILLFLQDKTRSSHPIPDIGLRGQIPKTFFLIYYGWITFATILNTLVLIQYTGYSLNGPILNIFIPIAVWLVIAFAVYTAFTRRIPYTMAVLWTLIGIYVQKQHVYGGNWESLAILVAVLGLSGLVVFKMLRFFMKHGKA